MWNLVSVNPICQKKSVVDAQKKHLYTINHMKPAIDNKPPRSSIKSYLNNKYENRKNENNLKIVKIKIERNAKIFKENQILLKKMMKIEKTDTIINPKCLQKHLITLKSLQNNFRHRESEKIDQENQDLLKRLRSALSDYGKHVWEKEKSRNESYKKNLMTGAKKNSQYDYSELAGYNGNPLKNYSKTLGNSTTESFRRNNYHQNFQNLDSTYRPFTAPKTMYKTQLPILN